MGGERTDRFPFIFFIFDFLSRRFSKIKKMSLINLSRPFWGKMVTDLEAKVGSGSARWFGSGGGPEWRRLPARKYGEVHPGSGFFLREGARRRLSVIGEESAMGARFFFPLPRASVEP